MLEDLTVVQEVSSTTTDALVWSTRNSDQAAKGVFWVHPVRRFDKLTTAEATFGRAPDCSFPIPDNQVSRVHASLISLNQGAEIYDRGSRNGTFVNRQRVQTQSLRDQDVVRIGGWVGVYLDVPDEDSPLTEVWKGVFLGTKALAAYKQAMRAAQSPLPVIISGETGAGKEVLASTIHRLSGRPGHFIAVNCAALPESLAEGELFGYRKGAFTGANKSHPGYFRSAERGTLLLDEIADLAPSVQAKLLRVLEERAVTPLGESHPVPIDVRVLTAGQGRLCDAVVAGRFRADLYSRLRGMELNLPPLRERREEVFPIFHAQIGNALPSGVPELTPEFVEALLTHDWPMNVREVVQLALQLTVLYGDRPTWTARLLPDSLRDSQVEARPGSPFGAEPAAVRPSSPPEAHPTFPPDRRQQAQNSRDQELQLLLAALQEQGGNVSRAAAAVGISRQRAYRLLEQRPDLDLSRLRHPR